MCAHIYEQIPLVRWWWWWWSCSYLLWNLPHCLGSKLSLFPCGLSVSLVLLFCHFLNKRSSYNKCIQARNSFCLSYEPISRLSLPSPTFPLSPTVTCRHHPPTCTQTDERERGYWIWSHLSSATSAWLVFFFSLILHLQNKDSKQSIPCFSPSHKGSPGIGIRSPGVL